MPAEIETTFSAEAEAEPLAIALGAALPLLILEMERRGGPTADEWQMARDFAGVLASKGDVLLYGVGEKNEAAALFNTFARAMCVSAFAPGGVHFCGVTYCRHHPGGRRQQSQACPDCVARAEEAKPCVTP